MPHHWFHHGQQQQQQQPMPSQQPVPPPLPPRRPNPHDAAQGSAQPPPATSSMPPRPPGYGPRPDTSGGLGAGLGSPTGQGGAYPRPPMSPNKRPYHYPPPPPGPPPGQPGYFQQVPPLPPRPATSSPHIRPQDHGRVYAPPSASSPTTPGSEGFSIPPPPSRTPQPYSFTPSTHGQNLRLDLQGQPRPSPPPAASPPFVTPQQTPTAGSVPNSPPPPYSPVTSLSPASAPAPESGRPPPPPKSPPVQASERIPSPRLPSPRIPSPRVPSPAAPSSAPISPLPRPSDGNSTRFRPSPSPGNTGNGRKDSQPPVSPNAAADNLDALLQSLSVEFSIPSPAISTFPPGTTLNEKVDSSSHSPVEPPPQIEPLRSPRLGSFGAYRPPGQHSDSPSINRRAASTSPRLQQPPYPVQDDKTPDQPALPLFMQRYAGPEEQRPAREEPRPVGPKVYKAYNPSAGNAGESTSPGFQPPENGNFTSYKPETSVTIPPADSPVAPDLKPAGSQGSFGPLRPVTMLFDPFQRERIGVAQEPPATAYCIDFPVTFTTDWYWHPDVPDFLACSRCYVDYIFKSKFRSFFESKTINEDGKSRVCSFGHPRMKDHLFKRAVSTGSMNECLDWMMARVAIPDCRGMAAVLGRDAPNLLWYKPSDPNSIPGFIACQACYEDRIMCYPAIAQENFTESPRQQPDELWACDFASPFIQRQYELSGEQTMQQNSWQKFCQEARAKLGMPLCSGFQLASTFRKTWFVPDDPKLKDLVLCQSCYCDYVLHSGQESQWRTAPELSSEAAAGAMVRCGMGFPSFRVTMKRTVDDNAFDSFWEIAHKILGHKFCDPEGIRGGEWFTLAPSDGQEPPSPTTEFLVCGACRDGIFEALGMADIVAPIPSELSSGAIQQTKLCSFNPYHSRFTMHMLLALEAFLTRSASSLSAKVAEYAAIPPCPLNHSNRQSNQWYGWYDCTICPECYHDVIVMGGHGALTSRMELRNDPLEQRSSHEARGSGGGNGGKRIDSSAMCELYSPRMRNLFKSCERASPPDPTALLHFSSSQRRVVFMETVPQSREIISETCAQLEQKHRQREQRSEMKEEGYDIHRFTGLFEGIPPTGIKGVNGNNGNNTWLPPNFAQQGGFAYRELLAAAQLDRHIWDTVARSKAGGQNLGAVLGGLERRWKGVE